MSMTRTTNLRTNGHDETPHGLSESKKVNDSLF